MALSDSLGTAKTVRLGRATIDYRERGEGSPIVFVHGLLVNADLWRHVVPPLADAGHRCIAPDWPLGSHSTPVPDADVPYARKWGMRVAVGDLHNVIRKARRGGNRVVVAFQWAGPRRWKLCRRDLSLTVMKYSPGFSVRTTFPFAFFRVIA